MWSNKYLNSNVKIIQYILLDILQAVGIIFFIAVLRIFPLFQVSQFGGYIGSKIGMMLPVRKRAYRNLSQAMPELSQEQQDQIIKGMFENLSRTIVEFAFLKRIKVQGPNSQVEVKGMEILEQLKQDGKGAILFSAHLSTWELGSYVASVYGLETVHFYRNLNYYLTNKLVRWRYLKFAPFLIAKGKRGAYAMVKALKGGKHIGILTDQKFQPGKEISFFGIPVKTPSGGAQLALKYNLPFVPVQVERLNDISFRVTYHPPLQSEKKDPQEQCIDLMTQMNVIFESWIRQHPEQWLWLHRRWI